MLAESNLGLETCSIIVIQDGTFSLADFLDAFSEHEVQRVLRAYENSVTVDIHCAGVGDWTTSRLSKEACCRYRSPFVQKQFKFIAQLASAS